MCYQIEIEPRDVMYFRDGKPIGASAEGSGASWPLPSVFHSALLSQLHIELGENIGEWESEHRNLTDREKDKGNIRFQFGGLKTWGPFPSMGSETYVPTPADIEVDSSQGKDEGLSGGVLQPIHIKTGTNNLPAPLRYPIASTLPPSKSTLGEWISLTEYEKYLRGQFCGLKTVASSTLFSTEIRPGIGLNPDTGTTEKGKFYSAEYLRLIQNENSHVSMRAFAACEARQFNESSGKDVLEALFKHSKRSAFVFGGQRGVAWLEGQRNSSAKPMDLEGTAKGKRLKWTLLSPAYFAHGWRPGWINMPANGSGSYVPDHEPGHVMLKKKVERNKMSRREWRKLIAAADFINARLVAARIPKPTAISGWKLDATEQTGGSPKATKLFVPAGAVFYFECDSESDTQNLFNALHGQTKSDFMGEQGFGLGLCSTWELNEI